MNRSFHDGARYARLQDARSETSSVGSVTSAMRGEATVPRSSA